MLPWIRRCLNPIHTTNIIHGCAETQGIHMHAYVLTLQLRREFDDQLEVVLSIGQQQLLRRQISNELNFSCQLDSNLLCVALKAMNKSLMLDIRAHYRNPGWLGRAWSDLSRCDRADSLEILGG